MTTINRAKQLGALLQEITARCSSAALEQAAHFGIPEAQSRALAAFESEQAVRIGELARRMELAPSRLTRLVDGLVESGLARRVPDPADRRATFVQLTRKGLDAREGLSSVCARRYNTIMKRMSSARGKVLLEVLAELVDAMQDLEDGSSGNAND